MYQKLILQFNLPMSQIAADLNFGKYLILLSKKDYVYLLSDRYSKQQITCFDTKSHCSKPTCSLVEMLSSTRNSVLLDSVRLMSES